MKYSHKQLDEMLSTAIPINHSIDFYGAPCRILKTGTGYEIRIFQKSITPTIAIFNPNGHQESAHQVPPQHLECALYFVQEHLASRT